METLLVYMLLKEIIPIKWHYHLADKSVCISLVKLSEITRESRQDCFTSH